MSQTNWKNFERRIAKELGGKRILEKGRSVADVEILVGTAYAILIDCKARKKSNLHPAQGLAKLEDYCEAHRVDSVGVLCWRDNGKRTVSVYMYLESLNVLLGLAAKIPVDIYKGTLIVSIDYKDFKELVEEICG